MPTRLEPCEAKTVIRHGGRPLLLRWGLLGWALALLASCKTNPPPELPDRIGNLELRITELGATLHRGGHSLELESRNAGMAPVGEGATDVFVAVSKQWEVNEPLAKGGAVTRRGTTKLYLVAASGLALEETFEFPSLKKIKYSGGGWESLSWHPTLHDMDDDGRYELRIGQTSISSSSARGLPGRTYYRSGPGQRSFEEIEAGTRNHADPESDVAEACAKVLGATCEFLRDERLNRTRPGFGDVGNLRAYLAASSNGAIGVVVARENAYTRVTKTLEVRRVGEAPDSVPEHPQNSLTQTWSADGLTPAVVVRYVRDEDLYVRAYPWAHGTLGEPSKETDLGENDCVTVHPLPAGPPVLVTKTCEEEQPPPEDDD